MSRLDARLSPARIAGPPPSAAPRRALRRSAVRAISKAGRGADGRARPTRQTVNARSPAATASR